MELIEFCDSVGLLHYCAFIAHPIPSDDCSFTFRFDIERTVELLSHLMIEYRWELIHDLMNWLSVDVTSLSTSYSPSLIPVLVDIYESTRYDFSLSDGEDGLKCPIERSWHARPEHLLIDVLLAAF